ncbi:MULTISPECIES: hypothetical protein [Methylobacter]
MRVNYFGYCLKNPGTGQKGLFDLSGFLKAYCRFENIDFKNNFKRSDEHLYLLHHINDTFLFLITRSNELIRRINTNDLSIGDVHSLLEQDEQLGFASYVMFKENYFSFGSTLLAPKIDIFASYLNDLFNKIGINDWMFLPQALLYQATKDEVLNLAYIGKTTIELSKQNSFFQDLVASASADTTDTLDLEGIEITIKPKKRKNIKPFVTKFLNTIPDEGIEKMIMKAKDEGMSQMTDLYLVGKGAICDSVDKSRETRIPHLLELKADKNKYLIQKLTEYRSDESFEEISLDALVRFSDVSAWTNCLPVVQQVSSVESELVNESS